MLGLRSLGLAILYPFGVYGVTAPFCLAKPLCRSGSIALLSLWIERGVPFVERVVLANLANNVKRT
ncbi:MAG: hypothetical protein ACI9HK_003948 [Pirellulaceae bacterium]|jgi:hypothetical protein